METKKCPRCGKIRNISDYNRDPTKKGDISYWCKDCVAEKSRTYYQKNKERLKEARRIRYQKEMTIHKQRREELEKEEFEKQGDNYIRNQKW